MRALVMAAVALGLLAGCDSRLMKPGQWFTRTADVATLAPEGGYPVTRDLRPLLPGLSALRLDPAPGGAIVLASATPAAAGYSDLALVPQQSEARRPVAEDGVLRLDLRGRPPLTPRPGTTARARSVTVALFVSNQTLAGLRGIEVVSADGTRSVAPR